MDISIKESETEPKVYEETHTSKSTFTIEDLDREIQIYEHRLVEVTAKLEEIKAKKAAALALKQKKVKNMEEKNRQEEVSKLFDKVWNLIVGEGLTVGEINMIVQGVGQRLNSIQVGNGPAPKVPEQPTINKETKGKKEPEPKKEVPTQRCNSIW